MPCIDQNRWLDGSIGRREPSANGDPEGLANFLKANSATGSLPRGEDVGNMAVFLSADENQAITGQCINVDRGVFPQ